jgi:hypothetical protein
MNWPGRWLDRTMPLSRWIRSATPTRFVMPLIAAVERSRDEHFERDVAGRHRLRC